MADEEKNDAYAWEGAFERSWDSIKEDENGALQIHQKKDEERIKRRLEIVRSVRKGLIRYLYVIIDLSKAMSTKDWKPHRCGVVLHHLEDFIKAFLDQNPISQLGIIAIYGNNAEKVSEMSGNPKQHVDKLRKLKTVKGEPSLQNALELAKTSLKIVPSYGSREILAVYGSLTTADPGDIFATSTTLKRENIRCSFVGIGAEMYLLQHISDETNGQYLIPLDQAQLQSTLAAFTVPAPTVVTAATKYSSMIQMGFPEKRRGLLSLCVCHQAFTTVGYFCPRCLSKSCDIPTTCRVCSLPLVSSSHLARSYHHLFPIDAFTVLSRDPELKKVPCYGCIRPISASKEERYQCPKCRQIYCQACDLYIHDSLHNCIGCQEGNIKST